MSDNNLYTMKTASLKATKADFRNIDARRLEICPSKKGGSERKDILDVINNAVTFENVMDSRLLKDTIESFNTDEYPHMKYSLKKGAIIKNEDGSVVVKDLYCPYNSGHASSMYENGWMNGNSLSSIEEIVSIYNGVAYNIEKTSGDFDASHVVMIFDTENLIDARLDSHPFDGCDRVPSFGMFEYGGGRGYYTNQTLKTFVSPLPNLRNGTGMFGSPLGYQGTSIESFKSEMPKLINGSHMFKGCSNLENFECDELPLLKNGSWMFAGIYDCWGPKIKSFNTKLPSLENGRGMFCSGEDNTYPQPMELESFNVDLPVLKTGDYMFYGCNNLTSFNSSIPKLEIGSGMFHNCILDAESLLKIVDSLPTLEVKESPEEGYGTILIGLGITNDDEVRQELAISIGFDSWEEIVEELTSKNWKVEFQYNGTIANYSLRNNTVESPIYAKLIEIPVVSQDEIQQSYGYTSQDGSKFYIINWYHFSNNNEGYTQFNSIEEAIEYFDVIPRKRRNEV